MPDPSAQATDLRVQGLEDVRLELGGLAREVRVERKLTIDGLGAIHIRVDGVVESQAALIKKHEALQATLSAVLKTLLDIRAALGMNGTGGSHG